MVFLALLYRRWRYGYQFRRIPLTQGQYAIVDPQDYERLSKYKWYARKGIGTFYAARNEPSVKKGKRRIISMHRVVLPVPKGMFVDHINHNGLDNRKTNLRPATPSQNTCNSRRRWKKTSSKYKGISWDKRSKKWKAAVRVDYKLIFVGYFDNEEEAARAYDSAARVFQGEYAKLNFP